MAKRGRKSKLEKRNEMVTKNLRLVISIARKYQNRGLEMDDLIAEGNTGLMRASEMFDAKLGYKFSTYATHWIRQAVLRAIYNTGRTIRLPIHLQATLFKIMKAELALSKEKNRVPSIKEITAFINKEEMSKKAADRVLITEDKVLEVQSYRPDVLSLDRPVKSNKGSSDTESTLADFIPSEEVQFSEQYEDHDLQVKFNNTVDTIVANGTGRTGMLQAEELEVLKLRYGIGVDEEMTLEQIGEMKNLTKERIRQIEKSALTKLRHPANMNKLKALRGME